MLRGDLPRLARATSIITSTPSLVASGNSFTNVKRSKPLKYAYEKEIVLYAHHKSLDYFCTECIYSPEAFRGSARALIKDLERINPASILDILKSGEDMAKQVPTKGNCSVGSADGRNPISVAQEEGISGCGSNGGRVSGGELATMNKQLQENESASVLNLETEVEVTRRPKTDSIAETSICKKVEKDRSRNTTKQRIGQCSRCGYISSQDVCKACTLLESLNKNKPKTGIIVDKEEQSEAVLPALQHSLQQLEVHSR